MDDGSARRRSARDWLVDAGLFVAALAYAAFGSLLLYSDPGSTSATDVLIEQVVALCGCASVWVRRRWPLLVAVALIPLSVYGFLVDGAQLVALFTLAVHRQTRVAVGVAASSASAACAFMLLTWPSDEPVLWVTALTVVGSAGAVGWGLFVRHRRQLIASLRERAVRAEAEATLRAEQAQHEAREELAREMHDVLGHRLSLLSVHAGALEYRKNVSADDVVRTAGVLRATAHQALQDLREVIGVLRAPVGELPQPVFTDIPALVEESRRAGTTVVLDADGVEGAVPDGLGRTTYRIVQEALTNARKHAESADVRVLLTGKAGGELTIEVTNGAPGTADDPPLAGKGRGLVGLTERVVLVGGRLEHGVTADGGFRLCVRLPWPP